MYFLFIEYLNYKNNIFFTYVGDSSSKVLFTVIIVKIFSYLSIIIIIYIISFIYA